MSHYVAKCILGWWAIYWNTDERLVDVMKWRPSGDHGNNA